jgi:uncharacterized protein YndB with AHSA1/START domain
MNNSAQQTIKKTIDIRAPREKVWEVLFSDNYTRIWYAIFSEGTYAETDWQPGSKTVFRDKSGFGMVGRIVTGQPYEKLSIEFEGIITDGREDYESTGAQQVKGARETYILSRKEDCTQVSIESDMTEDYFESMSAAWEKALQKVKELSEAA